MALAAAVGPQGQAQPARLEAIWHAPMVCAAAALTAGIILDRYLSPPLPVSLLATVVCLAAWLATCTGPQRGLALAYLAMAAVACGAARHHLQRDSFADDDIGWFAPEEPRPADVRGVFLTEPARAPATIDDPLRSRDRPASSSAVLAVAAIRQREGWEPVSGRLRLLADDALAGLHAGDTIEAVGRLERIHGPANPGEFDQAAYWRDRGIRVQLRTRSAHEAVIRIERGWHTSLTGLLAVIRGWGERILEQNLPPQTSGLAAALLLGEGAPMGATEWEKYQRTGVIHVLAISGQHLVILAGVLWLVMGCLDVRQRPAAALIAAALFAYALLTGGRPPALRAAIMVAALSLALVLRRRILPANALGLSWLVVLLLDPADVFSTGCQLSFLAVAILYWGTRWLHESPLDPLQQLLDQSRPTWQRLLLWQWRQLRSVYLVTAVIWLAVTPLVAARYHLVAPIGFLLGPPLTLLTTIALIGGFLLLGTALVLPPLTAVFAIPVHWSLALCAWLVDAGDRLPGAYFYVGDVPDWWSALFYIGLLAALTQARLRRNWHWAIPAGFGWLCVGLVGAAVGAPSDEARFTFLAVGHGGCIVIETPDGRTLVYDAGAIAGPEVTRRHIAPFLWQRGIRRIDEIFVSHADLDHFNGLPDLLARFAVGQVTCTPTFADKPSRAVAHTLAEIQRQGVPVRIARAGDILAAGALVLEVLHPPASGPPGNENSRSLVLLVQHGQRRILLTGDLEGAGQDRLLSLPPRRVDVLMAPHHGSRLTNSPELARWCRPRVVIACQGPPTGRRALGTEPYSERGAYYFGTWPHGAVTVRSHASGLVVETFVTNERIVIRGGRESESKR